MLPPGRKICIVQIDYMCSLVKADGTCDTVNGHSHLPRLEALQAVAQAFENRGINVHFDVGNNYQGEPHIVPVGFAKGGNIIPEETCVDTDPHANPPRRGAERTRGARLEARTGAGEDGSARQQRLRNHGRLQPAVPASGARTATTTCSSRTASPPAAWTAS